MAVEREGIAVDITANTADFVGGIGSAISSLSGFRLASFAAAGATAAIFAGSSFKEFAGFERDLTIAGQKLRLTGDETAALRGDMDAFGASTLGATFSQSQLAAALNSVAQGSNTAADSLLIVESAAALTAARGGDLIENTKLVNQVLEATGRKGTDAALTVDKLRAVHDEYGVSLQQLSDDLATSQSRADRFGVSMEENLAIIGALAKVKSFDAKQMFSGLSQLDTPKGDTNKALIKELGVSAFDAEKRLKPLSQIVAELNFQIARNGLNAEEAGRKLVNVFGDRAGTSLNDYRRNVDNVTNAQGLLAASAGSTAQSVEDMSKTSAANMADVAAKWDDVKAKFGEKIAPIAVPILINLDSLENLDDPASVWTPGSALKGLFDSIAQIYAESWATLKANIAEKWGALGAWFSGLPAFAVDVWGKISSGFATAVTNVASWVTGAGAWLADLGSTIVGGIKDFSGEVWSKISGFLKRIGDKWNAWKNANPWFGNFTGGLIDAVQNVVAPQAPVATASATSSSATTINVDTISLPSVQNANDFTREIDRMSRLANQKDEFNATYAQLSPRRTTA